MTLSEIKTLILPTASTLLSVSLTTSRPKPMATDKRSDRITPYIVLFPPEWRSIFRMTGGLTLDRCPHIFPFSSTLLLLPMLSKPPLVFLSQRTYNMFMCCCFLLPMSHSLGCRVAMKGRRMRGWERMCHGLNSHTINSNTNTLSAHASAVCWVSQMLT